MTRHSRIAGALLLAAALGTAGCGSTVDGVTTAPAQTPSPSAACAAPPAGTSTAARLELDLPASARGGDLATATLRVTPVAGGAAGLAIDDHIRLLIVSAGRVVGGSLIQTADLRPAVPVPAGGLTLPVILGTTANGACGATSETPVAPGHYTVVAVVPVRAPGSGELVSAPRELLVR